MAVGSPGDTIAAVATAAGPGALSVIRVSGADAVALVDGAFTGERPLAGLSGFRGAHGWVVDGSERVDEVVAWVYRAPRSYTGEDMVEISCHGGAVSAARILEVLRAAGARPAEPGEFTRRAFLAGRIDLTQAEAVVSVIEARGRRAHAEAVAQLDGGLSRRVRDAAEPLRAVLARLTVFLDFDEDVPGPPDVPGLRRELASARDRLATLSASHRPDRRLREGLRVALVGRPNMGKSSLLNALVGYDRAIVHAEPGTTRDVVEAQVEWAGIPVRLLDTAGLREHVSAVEAEGVDRGRREAEAADGVLWVVDGSVAPTSGDRSFAGSLDADRVVLVRNKRDLGADEKWANVHSPSVVLSAAHETGIEELVVTACSAWGLRGGETAGLGAGAERHAACFERAVEAADRAESILATGQPVELAAADLHRCLDALAGITGDQAGEDLLDHVFSRFCIGK